MYVLKLWYHWELFPLFSYYFVNHSLKNSWNSSNCRMSMMGILCWRGDKVCGGLNQWCIFLELLLQLMYLTPLLSVHVIHYHGFYSLDTRHISWLQCVHGSLYILYMPYTFTLYNSFGMCPILILWSEWALVSTINRGVPFHLMLSLSRFIFGVTKIQICMPIN